MQVLIPERTFTVRVGERQVEGMRFVSEWNGLIELRSEDNEVLIVAAPGRATYASTFKAIFADIFGLPSAPDLAETAVIKGSPGLLARLHLLPGEVNTSGAKAGG